MNKETLKQFEGVEGIYSIQTLNPVNYLHANNLAFLRRCHELQLYKYFHFGIVDPPYGIEVNKMNLGATKDSPQRNYVRGQWDSEIPTQEYWNLLWYCCRELIVWGGNYFVANFGAVTHPETGKPNPITNGRSFVVWDKGEQTGKQLNSFAFGELALTTIDKNPLRIRKARNARSDEDGEKRHDTQKPVYLYEALYQYYITENRSKIRVLDTNGGSFSHATAAIKDGVNLTIMDVEESYVGAAIEVHKQNSQQPRLIF